MKSKFTALILMLTLLLPSSVLSIQNTNNDDVSLDTATDQFTDDQDITCILNGVSGPATDDYKFYWLVNGVRKDQGLADQTVLPASLSNVNDQVACMVVDFDFSVQGIEVVIIQAAQQNQVPVVTLQNIYVAKNGVQVINLNNFVADDTTPAAQIIWVSAGNINTQITIDQNNVATIMPGRDFSGKEQVTFTATDREGLAGSDTLNIIVYEIEQLLAFRNGFVEQTDSFYRGERIYLGFQVNAGNEGLEGIDPARMSVILEDPGNILLNFQEFTGSIDGFFVINGEECRRSLTDPFCANDHPGVYYYVSDNALSLDDSVLGEKEIEVRVIDSEMNKQVNVLNNNPQVDLGNDFSIQPGEEFSYNALSVVEDIEDNDAQLLYAWDFDNDGVIDSNQAEGMFVYDAEGVYTLRLTVTDTDAGRGTDTIIVNVGNEFPIANAGPDRTAAVNEQLQFDGSLSSDPDGRIVEYDWSFGDGTGSRDISPAHSYSQEGQYRVLLTVTDNNRAFSFDEAIITVSSDVAPNQHPIANAGEDKKTGVLMSINFDGSLSSDPDGRIVEYDWSFGDGFSASGPQVSHSYNREGTFTVTLTVTDNDGSQDTDTLFVVVDSSENRGGDRDKRSDVFSGHKEIHDINLGNIRDLSGKSVLKQGEVARLLIRLNNQGDFDERGMQLKVYAPGLGIYNFVNNINLDVSQVKVVQADLVIPASAKKGAHLAKLTLKNAKGNHKEAYWQFIVV